MCVLFEYERGVVFRLGKLIRAKGPGLVVLLPFGVDRLKRMDLRTVALDVPPQDTITKDNVTLKINAVIYFRVIFSRQGSGGDRGLLLHYQPARSDHPAERGRPVRTGLIARQP